MVYIFQHLLQSKKEKKGGGAFLNVLDFLVEWE